MSFTYLKDLLNKVIYAIINFFDMCHLREAFFDRNKRFSAKELLKIKNIQFFYLRNYVLLFSFSVHVSNPMCSSRIIIS